MVLSIKVVLLGKGLMSEFRYSGVPDHITKENVDSVVRFTIDVLLLEVFILGDRFGFERLIDVAGQFKQKFCEEHPKDPLEENIIEASRTFMVRALFFWSIHSPETPAEIEAKDKFTITRRIVDRIYDGVEHDPEKVKQFLNT